MRLSSRAEQMGPSVFTTLRQMKAERLAAGLPVVDFSVGSPNIAPAPHIIKAIVDAAADPANYTYAIRDLDELCQTAAQWYARRFDVQLDWSTQVCSLIGSQDGLAHIAMCLVDKGDVVLVPDPCYPAFADGPTLSGAELHYMPLRPENDYQIDFEAIPEDIARRAKLIVVCYPNNPTTALAGDDFYPRLIEFAKRYDIAVLHDNAYCELVFDGRRGGSFLAYPGAVDVGVEFNSLSKTYGMAGARIGFCLGNARLVGALKQLKSNIDYGVFLAVQRGAIAALNGDQSCVATTCLAYQQRRDLLCDGLTALGWDVPRCQATMFVWAKLPARYTDSVAFCNQLAKEAGVLMTPGSAFGPSGEGHVRIALVANDEEIRQALEAIAASGMIRN